MQKCDKILDIYRIFCYNNEVKKVVNLKKLSQQKLIELYLKKCKQYDRLEARFRKLQEEKNAALKKLEIEREKNRLDKNRLFGAKSESSKSVNKDTFNEAEKNRTESKKGRPRGSKNYDVNYLEQHVVKTIYIDPNNLEELKANGNIVVLNGDISYKVVREPAKIIVYKFVTNKYLDQNTGKFYQGVMTDPFPHSICTASLAVDIMTNKFMYGLPYYRQSEVMINDGLYLSRQDLCNFQIRATEILKPFYEYLKKLLLNNSAQVINADETTLRVLETDKSKCYAWVYCTSFYNNPIYIYEYCRTRSRENIINFLDGYNGYLLTDGYSGYNNLNGIANAYCRAHARRKFVEIVKTLSDEQVKESVSNKIVKLIDKLFVEEAKFKENNYGPQTICEMRNSDEYIEILNSIFKILHEVEPEKGTALERAFKYILDREDGFKTFLEDGHIELSNNISERAIKPFVIARKNFLFSNTENGAESSLIYFSIQQTARANNVNPVLYITKLLNVLGSASKINDELLDSLLPWKIDLEKLN